MVEQTLSKWLPGCLTPSLPVLQKTQRSADKRVLSAELWALSVWVSLSFWSYTSQPESHRCLCRCCSPCRPSPVFRSHFPGASLVDPSARQRTGRTCLLQPPRSHHPPGLQTESHWESCKSTHKSLCKVYVNKHKNHAFRYPQLKPLVKAREWEYLLMVSVFISSSPSSPSSSSFSCEHLSSSPPSLCAGDTNNMLTYNRHYDTCRLNGFQLTLSPRSPFLVLFIISSILWGGRTEYVDDRAGAK